MKKISKNEYKKQNKPWITNGIIKSIRNKEKLYSKYLKEKGKVEQEKLHTEFKMRKNMITNIIRKSKRNFYNNYFLEHSKNARKLWVGINNIVNTKPKQNSMPTCIEEKLDNNLISITEPKNIANRFNNYFTSIADKILEERKYPGNKHFSNYLNIANTKSFMVKPTDNLEI